MPSRRIAAATAALAAAALVSPLLLAGPAGASSPQSDAARGDALARKLVKEATGKGANNHLKVFQSIADYNNGTRVAGSKGHEQSAKYVEGVLKAAGYEVSRHEFDFVYVETIAETLKVNGANGRDVPLKLMTYTASGPEGGVTAPVAVVPVDADGSNGCDAADFAPGAFTGKIALVKRGGCTFAVKQANAAAAGAVGAVIYNNTAGALNGTLGDPNAGKVPTGGISQADGEKLAAEAAAGPVEVTLDVRQFRENRKTWNVIAETKGGDADNTVFLGAHLDSVAAGPGINDNGSGSAGILQVAQRLASEQKKIKNKVKFAWWSAEEFGLLGSEAYVASLTPEQKKQIKLYLNFDMIASPNAAYFVYDGDDSDKVGSGPGPEGSAQLEKQITDFLDAQKIPHEGSDFTGRSDYGPFIEAGIPSGGTDTGAEGIKTPAQAAKFGGQAGVAYDVNYHGKGDDIGNIDQKALDINVDVIANAVGHYAYDLAPLSQPVVSKPTTGSGNGGGLRPGHDHEAAE
ncbi:Zn-dependent M28 family amino/carboxypeptidase [Streptomyces sp. 3211.6]|uniref:M28 family metallopeptidase n=1 Tax=Streptomyces TaxID=1883 RepID=UPI0009A49F77|nr:MULTISPECIES: M28 family metallopeptidase [Streptomyces]RKT05339.1 Zn-dependent M28 family amino/carboxypeptidase [Streptomyces sp. 3211.6]RPF41259.1 Zn-dependent M28 family amino/carboxypeptidase [Streptomyces sp. Ag109_G2-6]